MQKQTDILTTCIRMMSKLPLAILQRLAIMLAIVLCQIIPTRTAKYARLNIDIAFPHLDEHERQRIERCAARHEIQAYFEFLHIWGHSTQHNIALVHSVTGEQYLKNALATQQGVVCLIPHFGTWEIMNAWLSQFTALTVMYKPAKNAAANNFVLQARSRERAELVPTDERGVKQIFRALKQGGVTAILPDHSPDSSAELIEWFGVPLYSSQLSAKMIQKTKAKTLLMYAMRNAQRGFDIFIEPMTDDIYDTTQNGTLLIHQAIEQLIQRYPTHYHWSYKRFKASPATSKLYTLPHDDALALIRRIQA